MDEYINIGRWFSVLHRRSQIFVVEACEKLHLTYSEYVMLLRIYDHEGARQDELAAMLYLDKAVVTRTMTMLEKKGLVYREQDARDKRAKHVYLTDYGSSQLQESAPGHRILIQSNRSPLITALADTLHNRNLSQQRHIHFLCQLFATLLSEKVILIFRKFRRSKP